MAENMQSKLIASCKMLNVSFTKNMKYRKSYSAFNLFNYKEFWA